MSISKNLVKYLIVYVNVYLMYAFQLECRFPPICFSHFSMGKSGARKLGLTLCKQRTEAECSYIIEDNDRYVRSVKPYFQEFRTHAKGRWIGREVLEVFCREFGAQPPSYWKNAMRNGQVKVNNKIIDDNYRFRNGDALLHRAHRLLSTILSKLL